MKVVIGILTNELAIDGQMEFSKFTSRELKDTEYKWENRDELIYESDVFLNMDEAEYVSGYNASALGSVLKKHFGIDLYHPSKPVPSAGSSYVVIAQRLEEYAKQPITFGQHLDEVKSALTKLSEYLRGINDPNIKTVELGTAKKYIDAFLVFFEDNNFPGAKSTAVPAEIAKGLSETINKTDWSKTSSEARGWVKIISDIFAMWFKNGS